MPSSFRRKRLLEFSYLLRDGLTPEQANEAVQIYYEFCAETSGFAPDPHPQAERSVEGGVAISPTDAARCVLDTLRTLRFLAGIERALERLRARLPSEELRILYAGCGPFAALALPFVGREGLRWTCVDTHPASVENLRRLLSRSGTEFSRIELVCADAATLRGRTFHLVIAEVMQRALSKEPQLSLTTRLVPWIEEKGLLIPERIRLRATLADPDREFAFVDDADPNSVERSRVELGTLLDLSAETAAGRLDQMDDRALDLGTTEVPSLKDPLQMLVRTEIQIFDDLRLDDYDSGLTVPRVCHEVGQVRGGETIRWRFRLRPTPGIEVELVDG